MKHIFKLEKKDAALESQRETEEQPISLSSKVKPSHNACYSRSTDDNKLSDAQCSAVCNILSRFGFTVEKLSALSHTDIFPCTFLEAV